MGHRKTSLVTQNDPFPIFIIHSHNILLLLVHDTMTLLSLHFSEHSAWSRWTSFNFVIWRHLNICNTTHAQEKTDWGIQSLILKFPSTFVIPKIVLGTTFPYFCVSYFVFGFPLMSAEAQLSGDNSITVSTEDERMEYLTSSDSQDALSIPSDSATCMKLNTLV